MRDIFRTRRMWRPRGELKDRYEVVIVGGGSHGLATAYYLAKNHGITDVAVLEKGYIGSGAAGRNTTIIRSNYRTPEGAAFYQASVELYKRLSLELDFNLLFSQLGHLTLAHSDRALITSTERAEVNQLLGIDSRLVGLEEIAKLCPELDLSTDVTWPVLGALYHPPGGIIRHDAVVWGLARGADRRGVEIHPYTEVTGIERSGGRVTGVQTNRGEIACETVVSATAGWSTLVADLAGVPLPITTHILQAFVTEPLKPFLDVIIVSSQMHVYVSQTDRGEILIGAEIEPYTTYRGTSTFPFLEYSARHVLELFPQLESARVLRQWTGLCDISPDFSPILGVTELDGFLVSAGWGTYGFKAAPIVGTTLAELVATKRTPPLIAPFALERFSTDTLVSELAAAAVSH
ncbi:MAG: FAD-dependent oxidoreductase [Actinobacteria bacterium]|nr:FAD-dependent oxidoreductase [Actinomycetota bacterium]